ncbi:MAG: pyrroloquinoline quinone biosynthesis protein PqqB [Polyangiales bacterium]
MRIRILGSAAGGGFPQWNCGCDNCRDVRRGVPGLKARTQESVAISSDGDSWYLLNASPEVRAQLESFEPLHPRARRHSPLAGIVLTNGDLDHCLGLLSLRESHPLRLITTASIERGFREDNVLFRTLQRFEGQLQLLPLQLGRRSELPSHDGSPSGLTLEAVSVPGKLPLHLERTSQPSPEDNLGLLIHDAASGKTLGYFPGVGQPSPELSAALARADVVFFDGTFWSEEELPAQGLLEKRARDMAHWPVGGPSGSAHYLNEHAKARRILIHINNTNPILREGSAEAAELARLGIEVAFDGMELSL